MSETQRSITHYSSLITHYSVMDREKLIELYRQMLLIRRFEEKTAEMYTMNKIGGFCHLYIGQEAVAVGAIAAIREDDYAISSYREHGQALAKGIDPKKIMAELFGKATGISRGKGGSMHLFDAEKNLLGGHAIVGGHIPVATGVGFAIKYQGKDQVILCFFGDGAVNAGTFHESLNLAALWKLPVIYICENNFYGMGTSIARAVSGQDMYLKSSAYDIPGELVDGMNVLEVWERVGKAVERARHEQTPTFLEVRTYRFRGHSMSDPASYRTKEELNEQRKRDPIITFRQKLVNEGIFSEDKINEMEKEIRAIVEESVEFAEKSPEPPLEWLYEDVYV
ncbi:MAG: pyruvate dehydrogenase (acetyl-transferring) E1 component subunit alpha [Nitrospira sp.]|nr:pyruvate dehydrogenase (acetyl-transferring) E1 component subunit alpha [Nitrospira sp.]